MLSPFATSSATTFHKSFRNGIWKIVSNATRLDAEFQKQRAVFTICIPTSKETGRPYGFQPKPDVFEDDNESPLDQRGPIALIVVPSLRKCGNADGEFYCDSTVLVKCCAIQSPPEDGRPQQLPSSSGSVDMLGTSSNPSQISTDGKAPDSKNDKSDIQEAKGSDQSRLKKLKAWLDVSGSQSTRLEKKARNYGPAANQ